jgi:hypothetical protein
MAVVAATYPDDADAQTLYADARMNTMAWDYWQKDGALKPEAASIAAALERVMSQHRSHPGAHRYYIHLLEGSSTPERAEASADVLGGLMPAAGHMVHMPLTSIYGSGDTPMPRKPTSVRSPPPRTTSRSVRGKVCIRLATTRTTSTSSGRQQRSKAAALLRSMQRDRWPRKSRTITPTRCRGPRISPSRPGSRTRDSAGGRTC